MTDETEVEIVTRLQAVDVRDLYPDLASEDPSSRVCLLCGAKLKDKTHNLTRHLERHHAGALLQLLEQRNQASPSLLASKSKRVQQEKSAAARQPAGPDDDALLKADDAKLALARWLAQEQLPVDLVEKSGFIEFVEALNEQFNPPQGHELRRLLGELLTGQDDTKRRLDGDMAVGADTEPTVEMAALRATCRCSEDSPLVSYSRVVCDIPHRGEAKVRVLRAAASFFDAQTCRGEVLGKNGVLGRSFVGVVVDVQPPTSDATATTAVGHSIDVFDKVVASPYITRAASNVQSLGPESLKPVDSCLGVSASSGALAEYVVLPVCNLCLVPSALPDDLALLADDMSVVLAITAELELKHRNSSNVAILADASSTCLTTLLTRYLYHESQAATLHVFSTSSPSRFQHASTTPLDIYEPAAVTRVLARQSELAVDVCIDLIGSEASAKFATALLQSMGCLVLVDRGRLELTPKRSVAMDLNSVVVRELELVSVHDCREQLHAAVEYLSEQVLDSEAAAELRGVLLPVVTLPEALDELQTVAESTIQAKYLQVAPPF